MTNEEIKNRILMEMNDELTSDELRKLKMCLERNFYGITVVDNCIDIVAIESISNEKMISKFVFEQKIGGLSDNTIKQCGSRFKVPLTRRKTHERPCRIFF